MHHQDPPTPGSDAPLQSATRKLKDLLKLADSSSDPEQLVEAFLEVNKCYDRLCAENPVFKADQENTSTNYLAVLRSKLRSKLQRIASVRPLMFNHWKFATKHEQFFVNIAVGSPGDQPYVACQDKSASDRSQDTWTAAFAKLWSGTQGLPPQHPPTAESGAIPKSRSSRKQRARISKDSSGDSKPYFAPPKYDDEGSDQEEERESDKQGRKLPYKPLVRPSSFTASNEPITSHQEVRERAEEGTSHFSLPSAVRKLFVDKQSRPPVTTSFTLKAGSMLADIPLEETRRVTSIATTISRSYAGSLPYVGPKLIFTNPTLTPQEVHSSNIEVSVDPSILSPGFTLDEALRKVHQNLNRVAPLNSPVGKVNVKLSFDPPDPKAPLSDEEMDQILRQLEEIKRSMTDQKERVQRHEKDLQAHKTRLQAQEEAVRRMSQPGSQGQATGGQHGPQTKPTSIGANAAHKQPRRPTLEEVAAEYQRLLQEEQARQSSGAGAQGPRAHTEGKRRSGNDSPDEQDLRETLAGLKEELWRKEQEIRRLSRTSETAHSRHSTSAADNLTPKEKARRERSLISGASMAEVTRKFPAVTQSSELEDFLTIESKLDQYIAREDDYRARNPEPGQGFHYLQGDVPFWRKPWPPNWRVRCPWDFTRFHNHQDLQKLLKTMPPKVFDGNKSAYAQWQRSFYKVVHIQDLDVDHKFELLCRSVSDQVQEAITIGMAFETVDYCMAVSRLDNVYGAESRRPDRASELLTACKPFSKYDVRKATDFIHKLQTYVQLAMTRGQSSAGTDLMPTLKRIIPNEWLEDYVHWTQTSDTAENPETLFAYLKPIVDTKIELQPYRTTLPPTIKKTQGFFPKPKRESPKASPSAALVGAASPAPGPCEACQDDHQLRRCPHFYHRLSNVERRRLLERKKLCLMCFANTHDTDDCYNKRKCILCDARHNVWVHTADDDGAAKSLVVHSEGDDRTNSNATELSGDFLGAGFVANATGSRVSPEDDELYYAMVGGLKANNEIRRSPRLAKKKTGYPGKSPEATLKDPTETKKEKPKSKRQDKKKKVRFQSQPKKPSHESHDLVLRSHSRDIEVGLAQTVLNVQNPVTKQHMNINVLIDSAANHTAVSRRVADKLGLKGSPSPYKVVTFGGDCFRQEADLVQLTVRELKGKQTRTIMVRSIPNLCGQLKAHPWNELKCQWAHTKDLTFPSPVGDLRIDLLIGTENADFVASIGADILGSNPQDPIVRRTKIGLVPMGLTKPWLEEVKGRVNLGLACAIMAKEDDAEDAKQLRQAKLESVLYQDLKRLFAVEHAAEERLLRNSKERKALDLRQVKAADAVHQSMKYDPQSKSYRVGVPWSSADRPKSNLWEAMKMFRGQTKRVNHGSAGSLKMIETIKEWIRLGYAEILEAKEARRRDSFVIPSFIVSRTDKTSTQYRLVINAAKEFGGRSINDFILPTPDVMNDLCSVLLKFRIGRYSYTADIKHMFLRICTETRDQRFLRVLYQPERDGPIKVVQCSRHVFGLRSSPYIAMEVIRSHAKLREDRWPLAARAVHECSIVDDILTTANSERELMTLHKELRCLFADMSMSIHKCASNSPAMMRCIPETERAKQIRLEEFQGSEPSLLPIIKTLGLVYRPEQDDFCYEYSHTFEGPWTLRRMVSAVARLYDPIGLISPFLMAGRAIIQTIWTSGKTWDQKVNLEAQNKCDVWLRKTKELSLIRIPRAVSFSRNMKLVAFSDASKLGYAAAIYSVTNGESALVGSKTRVAPTRKEESIQRLELAGCQLSVETTTDICHALGINITDVIFYTDSITSLAWLRTTKKMSVFVGNRVCKIKDRTNIEQWFHVAGKHNPADLASRGAKPSTIAGSDLWLRGPDFIRRGEVPPQPPLSETLAARQELLDPEDNLRKINLFFMSYGLDVASPFELNFVKSRGSLDGGVRVLTQVVKAVYKLCKRPVPEGLPGKVRKRVMNALIHEHQHEYWQEEIEAIISGRGPPKGLKGLRPYLDHQCLLRVRSRLGSCWWLPDDTRNPVLLKSKGYLPKAILDDLHVNRLLHCGGPEQLLLESRARFWITSPRALCKETIRRCQKCRIRDLSPYRPPIADLHSTRLGDGEPLQAFKMIGVDMAGPFLTKGPPRTRSKNEADYKRYMLIFTCSVTRAVNLELMSTAESDSCAMAFDRFIAVYGIPHTVNSDRGSNFVGVRNEMRRRAQVLEATKEKVGSKHHNIIWNMNPPYSPNWGGHFERLIGVAKKSMAKLMDQHPRVLNDEELHTMFKRVQDLLNRRPILNNPTTDEEFHALTPNDFLKTGTKHADWLLPASRTGCGLLKRHRLLEKVVEGFWKLFIQTYIPTLHRANRWASGSEPVSEGDVVVVLPPEGHPGRWPLGRVKETYPGKDGHVRSVLIETHVQGKKVLVKRSASGLMIVPVNHDL